MTEPDSLFQENLQLAKAEYRLQHIYLRSRPRTLGLVLSNHCNLACIHCYQAKNGDSLLAPVEIGREIRRELAGFYPYLSTLDLLGGEVFLSPGFTDLVDDVAAAVNRPILRLTTNGTLVDDAWAERIVRVPFQSVTVSIDGATPAVYRRLRRGGELETALAGIRRIRHWKQMLGSEFPYLDSFFVIMRSNFREIPAYLELMRSEGIAAVALETMLVNGENTARTPSLVEDEVIAAPAEIAELHAVLRNALCRERPNFQAIRVSGLTTLFAAHGLDASFLQEDSDGLYPESDDLRPRTRTFDLCPNPWTTLFVTESGKVHLCFLAEPIGNVYEMPLAEIWNSPPALAQRSRMIAGRYAAAACSKPSCSWREGRVPPPTGREELEMLRAELTYLRARALGCEAHNGGDLPALSAVRRLVDAHDRTVLELQAMFRQLCDTNAALHERGQAYIDHLESELAAARQVRDALRDQQQNPLVRIALKASQAIEKIRRRT